ncbi:MAG: hypothetical protein O2924_04305 [Chloroflexi bacterium]|nr:hypothetical protein [Chloroflexota bacterium]
MRQPLGVVVMALTMLAASAMWLSSPGRASTIESRPALPHRVEMQPGDRALLADRQYIEFAGIVEDSRCPTDVSCIWQGRAVVEVEVAGESVLVTFIGGDSVSEPAAGYLVAVDDVQPYPRASQPTEQDDYVVTVTVTANMSEE